MRFIAGVLMSAGLLDEARIWGVKKAFQDGAQIDFQAFRRLGLISGKVWTAKWLVCPLMPQEGAV
jgi:hypothetical protein